jgi:hypothetical protein
MGKFTWGDFVEQVGRVQGGVIQDVASDFKIGKAALNASCNLLQQPSQLEKLNKYERGVYRGLCGNAGFNLPVTTTSIAGAGGQCPVGYFSTIQYVFEGTATTREVGIWYGKLKDIKFNSTRDRILIVGGSPTNANATQEYEFLATGSAQRPFSSFKLISIRRSDGQPDNCGTLPNIPGADPNAPPPPETCITVDLPGEVSPVQLCRPPNTPQNGKNCFTGGGYSVCLTPDGVEINEEKPPEIEVLDWVLVTITKFPPEKEKTIIQKVEANNDYFAGYFNWIVTLDGVDYRTPSLPVRKTKNAYKAPDNLKTYAVYSVNGAEFSVLEKKKKIPDPNWVPTKK